MFTISRTGFLACILMIALSVANGSQANQSQFAYHATRTSTPPGIWNRPGIGNVPGRQSNDEATLVLFCMVALTSGDLTKAERVCDRAILLAPSDPTPHKLRGYAYLMEGRYEQAHYDFSEAVRLAPEDAGNQFGLAETLRDRGDFNGAMHRFAIALKLVPDDPVIWNARCWTRGIFAKQLRQGLSDCNTALKLDPESTIALDSRGLIYLRLGRFNDALRDYNASIAQFAGLATSFYGRGIAKLRAGNFVGAARDLQKARLMDRDVDEIFADVPLLSPACRSAHAIEAMRAVCAGRQNPAPKIRTAPASSKSTKLQPAPAGRSG